MGAIIKNVMQIKKTFKILVIASIITLSNVVYSQYNHIDNEISHRKHARNIEKLKKSFKKNKIKFEKTKDARFATPEKYWEQEYIATMNPALKRPTPESLLPEIENIMKEEADKQFMIQPGTSTTPWIQRGPNNVGGRTRALVWDPNDSKGKKVWAGAVTGGLWYNNDITSATSTWISVSSVWANITVSCIAFDPNNTQIMYVGTGEGWGSTTSTSRGQGIYKSTDGGNSFTLLSSTTTYMYVNDIVVWNNNGVSEVWAAVDALYYGGQWNGTSSYGLKKSSNGGTTWSNAIVATPQYSIADIEIGKDNRIWVGTKRNPSGTSTTDGGGGRIFYTDNGTTWYQGYKHSDFLSRVEIACAPNDANTIYALFESGGKADTLVKSRDGGATWSSMKKPKDADNSIPGTDFTRGQAWYDLTMAVSPLDSNRLIVGGIDLFYSTNAGSSWVQISKWSNNPGLGSLNCSYVHADQHAIVFKPNTLGTVLFGCDGGVFYSSNITNNPGSTDVTVDRNNGYFATQFYAGDLSQTANKNMFIAGAQDNGTHLLTNAGISDFNMVSGGDGAYCFISASNNSKQISAYVYNNFYYTTDGWASSNSLISDGNTGKFINPAIWDENGPGLFSGKGALTLYRTKFATSPSAPSTITVKSSGSPGNASAFAAFKNATTGKTELFVGTDIGTIYKTSDAWATTPTFTQLGTVNAGNISSIAILNKDTLALTISNFGVNNVYVSTNGGTTWGLKDIGLVDMPVWSFLFNPNRYGEALIATELGIYGTNNIYVATPTWTKYNEGMGAVKTMQLKYRNSDRLIMAVTHGRGIFTSNAWSILDPITKFGYSDNNPCVNQIVTLKDSSLNGPTSWSWNITPKGYFKYNTGDSTSQNPKVQFLEKGLYGVSLTTYNSSGSQTISKNILVADTIGIGVNVSYSPTNPCFNDSVGFISNYTNPKKMNALKFKYKWYKNNVVLTAKDTLSYYKAYNLNQDSTTFHVVLSTTEKCAVPQTATSNKAGVVLKVKKIKIRCSNDTMYVVNKPAGGTVKWYKNGLVVGTGDFYHAKLLGNYYATYTNTGCTSDSSNTINLLSVGNTSVENQFGLIYPNPVKEVFNFESKASGQLELWSTNGQLVFKEIVEANKSYKFNINHLSNGNYLIKINQNGNSIPIKTIIKL